MIENIIDVNWETIVPFINNSKDAVKVNWKKKEWYEIRDWNNGKLSFNYGAGKLKNCVFIHIDKAVFLDESAKERKYNIVLGQNGTRKINDLGLTAEQKQKDLEEELKTFSEKTIQYINEEFPELNIRNIISLAAVLENKSPLMRASTIFSYSSILTKVKVKYTITESTTCLEVLQKIYDDFQLKIF